MRIILGLAVLTLAIGFAGVRVLPSLDRDESRFAQASAQMIETGDYVQIRFQDAPRHKKPIGIHWLQTASVKTFSSVEAREIWAYRLPSLLGAALAVISTYLAGCVLIGRRAALAGAALLGASVLLGAEAGIAKTDAMLVGLTAAAMAALAGLYEVRGRWLGVVFWVAVALGVLVKGPITPMVAGLAIVVIAAMDRRVQWLRPLLWWPGPALAVLIVAPWLISVQMATEGAFLREALGQDLGPKLVSGHESHGGPPGLHAGLVWFLIWPGTLFLLPGLVMAAKAIARHDFEQLEEGDELADDNHSRAARNAGLRFLVAWAAPTWLVFELLPTKLVHYPLPAYPALALMAGAAVAALSRKSAPPLSTAVSFVLFAAAGVSLIIFTQLLPIAYGPGGLGLDGTVTLDELEVALQGVDPVRIALVGFVGLLFLVVPFALWRRPNWLVALACLVAGGWHWWTFELTTPKLEPLFVSRTISQELEALSLHPTRSSSAKPPLVAVGFTEPSLVFATATQTVLAPADEAAALVSVEVGRAAIVLNQERAAFEAELLALGATAIRVGELDGFNYSRGAPVSLTIYRIIERAGTGDPRRPAAIYSSPSFDETASGGAGRWAGSGSDSATWRGSAVLEPAD